MKTCIVLTSRSWPASMLCTEEHTQSSGTAFPGRVCLTWCVYGAVFSAPSRRHTPGPPRGHRNHRGGRHRPTGRPEIESCAIAPQPCFSASGGGAESKSAKSPRHFLLSPNHRYTCLIAKSLSTGTIQKGKKVRARALFKCSRRHRGRQPLLAAPGWTRMARRRSFGRRPGVIFNHWMSSGDDLLRSAAASCRVGAGRCSVKEVDLAWLAEWSRENVCDYVESGLEL